MTILLALPQDEEFGGVAYVVGHLARHLRSRGHRVLFLFPGKAVFLKSKTTKFGFPGFELRMQRPFGARHPVMSLPAFLVLFPLGMAQLLYLVCRYGIQVINVHYPTDCFFYLALCRRMLRLALVTSVHGADLFPEGERPARYSRAFNLLLASADAVVAPSRAFAEHLLARLPDLARKTTFIHNGIHLAELNSCGDKAKIEEPYILCVGAYKPQKALDVLIRAFKAVSDALPAMRLVLVGEGPLRGELESLARDLEIDERIEFLLARGRDAVIGLLRGCRLFVLPSRFETFGIVILEAMACRKPVVATTAGGIPEIVESEINGILVRPDDADALADALVRVLRDEALQWRLAQKGSATARERFPFDATASAYEALFHDVLRSESSQRPQPSLSPEERG